MSSLDPTELKNNVAFYSKYPNDKVLYEQLVPLTYSVGPATYSGPFYIPKTDVQRIANPIGKKAFINLLWSIDGTNYYPQKPILYQPGNPVPDGKVGATVGVSIDANWITFYFTHYYGSTVDFKIKYVLDNIL
jgi:hypothetical protein